MEQKEAAGAGSNWNAESKVYRWEEMAKRRNKNGSESGDAFGGALVTGEHVRVHETVQPAGLPANPAHTIGHTEVICVREGVLEFTYDGKRDQAKAGDVIFVAKGTLHSVRNAGDGPASYIVVAIGGDVAGA